MVIQNFAFLNFYGRQTIHAVQQFQRRYMITIDGLASFPLREELVETLQDNAAQATQPDSTAF